MSSATPLVGLSLMPEPAFAEATLPLFAEGLVDVVEWSFDMGWGPTPLPEWLGELLDEFADAGRLDGHGVSFSLLSHHPRQDAWCALLTHELAARPYRRVSEHVGFMAAGPYRRSTPLPLPHLPQVVATGHDQLARIGDIVGAPMGLENLATALCEQDATQQGALVADLVTPNDGWVVLDVHNLWCQATNFSLDISELLASYPLDRVRELHVSGGSWWHGIRRDTHDGAVPDEVMTFLPVVLARCPNVDTVILERIGTSFDDLDERREFAECFVRLRGVCGVAS